MSLGGNVVGLVPAAGKGSRLGALPCSKELFPVGLHTGGKAAGPSLKVAAEFLLDQFRCAGIPRTYIVLRQGKWDIPAYFGDGSRVGMDLAYIVIADSSGPPASIDRAFGFVADQAVAFGFPDILCTPNDAYSQLLERQGRTGADAVLGLYPAHDTRLMDMVRTDPEGRVTELALKPATTDLRYAWLCAVWTPEFTRFLHDFVSSSAALEVQRLGARQIDPTGDLPAGAVVQAAVQQGLHVNTVQFPEGHYIDIGTPADLEKALRIFRSPGA
ncbi:MAG: dTDP-glucose pyrophosphorylase [Gammaproteobacteria bacterium]|nr:dTDP-glucose pyrophosphorylase [Gammaproteobacteria bacterium]